MDPFKCDTLSHILGVKNMDSKEKYLGSPLFIGKSKVKSFEDINTTFERRLANWQGETMCQAGRGTMVKVVLNAVLMYQMSTLKIPRKLINKLDTLQRKFIWGYKANRGKIFQERRIPIQKDKNNSNWIWRGVEVGLKFLQQNVYMEVNNGEKTRIWLDNLIINLDSKPIPSCPRYLNYECVSELISPNSSE
ncbi:uncharacterized protein LOC113346225 [Papaver somniferum]|uniref:uncharacterized protein LOC113346225 n=1 Tax=Papaver somniferum TaxID=3469 RepID=UPI000E6FF4B9|nr:uncharacterized protein LOC113346225 [Papaver somniferum]